MDDNSLGEYRWECPYSGCKFFLLQYTKDGFEEKQSRHRAYHLEKMKEEREEREKNKSWPFPSEGEGVLSGVAATLQRRQEGQESKKDYNKLVLTMYDMIMFELHAIKIDEDCVIDGYSGEYRP